jgi:FkbM family methyltransferase
VRPLNALRQPYYVWRPSQIVRRLRFEFLQSKERPSSIELPWGLRISCRSDEKIGYSLHTTGVFDLTVTELIYRMVSSGDAVADVGANLGYMTSLMAALSGPIGVVYAFEPHPKIFAELKTHVAEWSRMPRIASIRIFQMALSDQGGNAWLREPVEGLEKNSGLASLAHMERSGGKAILVKTERLDAVASLEYAKPRVLKVDVEGHELAVLKGAEGLLKSKTVRDVIFEEFSPYPASSHQFLEELGYMVFHVEPHLFRPQLCRTTPGYKYQNNSAPNYLATIDPGRATAKFRAPGWRCLRVK